jgi:hypothetical protein
MLLRAGTAAKAILPVLLVLGLWIALFAMVGMQLFRCDLSVDSICVVSNDGQKILLQ